MVFSCTGAAQTVSAYPVLAGRHERCTRLGRRSPGATTAPEGEAHVKVQASLGCKRNILRPLTLYARALHPLSEQLDAATTLIEAYDCYLARCAAAGLTPERATAAWEAQSTPAWEAELVEAEADGPNALPMVDAQILAALGLPPHEEKEAATDEGR